MEQTTETSSDDLKESPSSAQQQSSASEQSSPSATSEDKKQCEDASKERESQTLASGSEHEYGEIPLADPGPSNNGRSSKLPLGQHKVMTRRSVGTIVVDSSEFATSANPDHHHHHGRALGSNRTDENDNTRRGRSELPQNGKTQDKSRSLSQGSRSLSRGARKRTSLYVTPIRRDHVSDAKAQSGEFSLADHQHRPKRSGSKKRRSSMEMNTVSKLEDFLPSPKEMESFQKGDFENNMASGSSKDRAFAMPKRQISIRQLSGLSSSSDADKGIDSPERMTSTPEMEVPRDLGYPLSPVRINSVSHAESPEQATSSSEDMDLTPKMKTSRRVPASPGLPSMSPASDHESSLEVTPPVAFDTPSRKALVSASQALSSVSPTDSEDTPVASNSIPPPRKSKRKSKTKKQGATNNSASLNGDGFRKVVPASQKRKNKKKSSGNNKISKRQSDAGTAEAPLPREGSPLLVDLSESERSELQRSPSLDDEQQEDETIHNSKKFFGDVEDNPENTHHTVVHFQPQEKGGEDMRGSLAKPGDAVTSDVLSVTGRSFTDYSDSEDIKCPVIQNKKDHRFSKDSSSKAIKSLGKLFRRKKAEKNEASQSTTKDSLWSRAFSKRKKAKGGGNEENVVVLSVS